MADEAARLRLLYDVGCAFAAQRDLDELIPLVIEKCRAVLEAEGAAVLLLDPARRELRFPYVADQDADVAERLAELRIPPDRGIVGSVLASGNAQRIDEPTRDPRFNPEVDRATGLTTRNLIAAPLQTRTGSLGVIEVINRLDRAAFTDDDVELLGALASGIAVALENATLWARLNASADQLRAEVGVLRRDLAHRDRFGDMVGTGPAMSEVFRLMESAAASPITVLIEGETGTGKELVARGIHGASPRASAPFVAVNCAAVPEALLESELFGHRRGSFTGATQDQRGLFEAASGGTVLLDEVGEMAPAMQAKLLRVLQEGEVMPIGERRPRPVDVRVVSATNRDLVAEARAGRFRDDLYFRLSAFPIHVPPLRERRLDIPPLADRFLAEAAERHRKRIPGIAPAALDLLVGFGWPGNLRELRNEIERAVALACDGETIGPRHLSAKLSAVRTASDVEEPATAEAARRTSSDLRDARTAFEMEFVAKVLREHKGNRSRAARALGISRVALQKKLKDYGLS
jgi:transcriptional regulator with GAF, ATPase, and Fis domain